MTCSLVGQVHIWVAVTISPPSEEMTHHEQRAEHK